MDAYQNLIASIPKVTQLPAPLPKVSPPPYTFRHSTTEFTEEIGVQTHEELVSFINWVNNGKDKPLAAIEPEVPRVL